jgi:hypothetical protein
MDPGVGGGESSGGVVFICLPFKKMHIYIMKMKFKQILIQLETQRYFLFANTGVLLLYHNPILYQGIWSSYLFL